MATLTWRDVAAPQLRSGDNSDAASAIARGIAALGASVQGLANAPEDRRQTDLANERKLLATQLGFAHDNAAQLDHLSDTVKASEKDAAAQEFGAIQSDLMGAALSAGQTGRSITDVTQSEIFRSLSPRAQGLAQGVLAQSFAAGQDDRRQQLNADRNFALAQEQERRIAGQAALSAQLTRLQIKAAEKAAKDPGALDIKDPETRLAVGDYTKRVANNMFEASGAAYADKTPADLAKAAGISDYSEYAQSWNALNAERKAQGKPALPENVMKSVLAGQAGKNSWPFSWGNEVDQSGIEDGLRIRADMYDNALLEDTLLRDVRNRVSKGQTYTTAGLQAEFDKLKPLPKPVAVKPHVPVFDVGALVPKVTPYGTY